MFRKICISKRKNCGKITWWFSTWYTRGTAPPPCICQWILTECGNLVVEMCVSNRISGSLSHVLQAVLLLLNLWTSSRHKCDNRYSSNLISAPLIPLLRRFQEIATAKSRMPRTEDVSCSDMPLTSFCQCLVMQAFESMLQFAVYELTILVL